MRRKLFFFEYFFSVLAEINRFFRFIVEKFIVVIAEKPFATTLAEYLKIGIVPREHHINVGAVTTDATYLPELYL